MKKNIVIALSLLCFHSVFSQIGVGTGNPDSASMLDIVSSDKGVLLPRVTTEQRLAIKNPSDGLLVYDITENRFFHYNAKKNAWEKIITQNDIDNGTSIGGKEKVKNIIFMIGDGMSYPQIYATYVINNKSLNITTFPYTGIIQTFSANNLTTDSAAGATALGSGVKTNNGYIGVDHLGNPVTSIMTEAKNNGLSTGIVATISVTHATPGAFYAHNKDRFKYTEIAADFLNSDMDVCIGSGGQDFSTGLRSQITAKGYDITYGLANTLNSTSDKLLGLIYNRIIMPRVKERGDLLSQTTQKALDILSKNEKGFFLMVEGSQIDKGGEANDGVWMAEEMLDFDKAIKVAKDFAEKDENTLVVVTADHETGGLVIYGGSSLQYSYTGTGHSALPVPVFAYGPGAHNFIGYFDNTEFKGKFKKLLNF